MSNKIVGALAIVAGIVFAAAGIGQAMDGHGVSSGLLWLLGLISIGAGLVVGASKDGN